MSLYDWGVYRRKHFPGEVRPALPALWSADDLEIGRRARDSMPRIAS